MTPTEAQSGLSSVACINAQLLQAHKGAKQVTHDNVVKEKEPSVEVPSIDRKRFLQNFGGYSHEAGNFLTGLSGVTSELHATVVLIESILVTTVREEFVSAKELKQMVESMLHRIREQSSFLTGNSAKCKEQHDTSSRLENKQEDTTAKASAQKVDSETLLDVQTVFEKACDFTVKFGVAIESFKLKMAAFIDLMNKQVKNGTQQTISEQCQIALSHLRILTQITQLQKILQTVLFKGINLQEVIPGQDLTIEPTPFSDLLRILNSMLAPAAKTKQLELKIPSCSNDFLLPGDEFLYLLQILINLLKNAIKFTDVGYVSLSYRRNKKIKSADPRYDLFLEVEDTGIGIHEEDIPKLFKPYSQVSPKHKRQLGTGLGLSISKELAARMGDGKIGVKSSVIGKGTTIEVQVQITPVVFDEKQTLAQKFSIFGLEEQAMPQPLCSKHILMVEDSKVNRDIFVMHFTKKGYEVDTAENGCEAIEKCSLNTYEIIFMDILMPIVDGWKATQKIRQLPNGATVPIIALTGSAQEYRVDGGMSGCLAKPYVWEEFETIFEQFQIKPRKKAYSIATHLTAVVGSITTSLDNRSIKHQTATEPVKVGTGGSCECQS